MHVAVVWRVLLLAPRSADKRRDGRRRDEVDDIGPPSPDKIDDNVPLDPPLVDGLRLTTLRGRGDVSNDLLVVECRRLITLRVGEVSPSKAHLLLVEGRRRILFEPLRGGGERSSVAAKDVDFMESRRARDENFGGDGGEATKGVADVDVPGAVPATGESGENVISFCKEPTDLSSLTKLGVLSFKNPVAAGHALDKSPRDISNNNVSSLLSLLFELIISSRSILFLLLVAVFVFDVAVAYDGLEDEEAKDDTLDLRRSRCLGDDERVPRVDEDVCINREDDDLARETDDLVTSSARDEGFMVVSVLVELNLSDLAALGGDREPMCDDECFDVDGTL